MQGGHIVWKIYGLVFMEHTSFGSFCWPGQSVDKFVIQICDWVEVSVHAQTSWRLTMPSAPDSANYKKNNFYESSSLPCCLSSAIRCLFYPPLLSNSVAHISSALWVFAPNHTADVGFILQQTLIFITLRFVVFFRNNIPYNSYRLRRRSKKLMNVK